MFRTGWAPGDIIESDAPPIGRERLAVITQNQIRRHFRPFMKIQTIHFFASLLAGRPACGQKLVFDSTDCTFIKGHVTCPHCRLVAA
jgi:hypothetical protein